jgi:hypothetical protein
MAAVTGGDGAVVAQLCAAAAPRLHVFDTQSLVQLFCASVKHKDIPFFSSFVSSACHQLSKRIESMDGVSSGHLAGALATASQSLPDIDPSFAEVQNCMVAICSRWLLPPSLTLGPQHTAFMCRCLVSSFTAVQSVIGSRMSSRSIRHRVASVVEGVVSELNWFSIAHVELLLILLSNHRSPGPCKASWLSVPNKHKNILKSTRQRMVDLTTTMFASYATFDTEASTAMTESCVIDVPLTGAASVLMCGGGGPGNALILQLFGRPGLMPLAAGDDSVKKWLLKGRQSLQIVSWSRTFGAEATVGAWLSLDNKCDAAVLRHPGCPSSCTMLLHMTLSGVLWSIIVVFGI